MFHSSTPSQALLLQPFLRRFQVVVDLPLGFDEFMAGLAQEVGRMEGRHDGYPVVVDPVSARTDDARVSSQKETEATLPRPMMTFGFTCRISSASHMDPQKWPSSIVGVRLPRGRHFTIFVT